MKTMRLKGLRARYFLLLLVCVAVILWAFKLLDSIAADKVKFLKSGAEFPALSNAQQVFSLYSQKRHPGKTNIIPAGMTFEESYTPGNYSSETHPWMFARPLSELEMNIVPNHVFFVWCDNRTFTFNDHLSVLSAWKLLEPDKLEIHSGTAINTDKYNQWFLELNQTIPALTVKFIQRNQSICLNPLYYALEVLDDRGGVYMDFSTVLLRPVHFLRRQDFSISFSDRGSVALISSKIRCKNLQGVLMRTNEIHPNDVVTMLRESVTLVGVCPSVSKSPSLSISERIQHRLLCVIIPPPLALRPLDLRAVQSQDLSILKDLYYLDLGTGPSCVGKAGSKAENIPFIVHYIWFNQAELSFRMYLSFLSTIHVAKADRVFIHCDLYLSGPYWKTVSSHPRVTAVYREAPHEIYGHRVLYSQHRSDVVRADLLDKYGGVYVDWDVLWLRSPRDLLTAGHQAVVNLDHMSHAPFSDSLNLGVFLARPRARFVRLWRRELRNYRSMDFYYNALQLPYKVYERHPDTLYVEKRLQVMCFWLKCHPIFHPDHKNWMKAQPFDWRTDVYSIHFTHPDPEEFESVVSLVNGTGTFADIGMFILNTAGELDVN